MSISEFQANEFVTRNNVNSRITGINSAFSSVLKPVSIYSNSSGTQGTVTFDDGYSTSQFAYIRVFYKVEDIRGDALVEAVVGNRVNLITGHIGDEYMYINARTVELNASSITLVSGKNGYMRYKASGGNTAVGSDIIYITDVVGYKY